MYNIKLVDDSELYTLVELNKEMRAAISSEVNNFNCLIQLLTDLTYKDAMVLGLYSDETLVGFVTGYGLTDTTYFFTGVYIQEGHKLQLLELLNKVSTY